MRKLLGVFVALLLSGGALALGGGGGVVHVPSAQSGRLGIDEEMNDEQERLISGFAAFELAKSGNDTPGNAQSPAQYFPKGSGDCATNISSNIKVNQNCLNLSDPDLQGRGQAQNETSIAIDPNNTSHVVATYNDYRRGDGTCGASWSTDGGRSWNDSTVPNNFTRNPTPGFGSRIYWQAGGDTSVVFDSKGNAYSRASCSSAGRMRRPTFRVRRAASSSSARRKTAARRGISPAAPSSRRAFRGRSCRSRTSSS